MVADTLTLFRTFPTLWSTPVATSAIPEMAERLGSTVFAHQLVQRGIVSRDDLFAQFLSAFSYAQFEVRAWLLTIADCGAGLYPHAVKALANCRSRHGFECPTGFEVSARHALNHRLQF